MFKCKYCDKEFESAAKLGGHAVHCLLNPNYERNKITTNNFRPLSLKPKEIITASCQYCGKEMTSTKSGITFHENRCIENPNRKIHPGNRGHAKGHEAWNKGLTALDDNRIKIAAEKRHQNFLEGNFKVNPHKWTSEEKETLRYGAISYIKKLKGSFKCRYSKKGCQYIDQLNELMGWHLLHAENGGEYEVAGYFLDGYDKELNIAFEYDELDHYSDVLNNILNTRDIERLNYIIERLHCNFYRYNESIKKFYKVN